MGMATYSGGLSTDTIWASSNTATTSNVVYISNSSYSALSRQLYEDSEELEKQRYAAKMRKRNLGYLWRQPLGLRRLQFQVKAPASRFLPCWSSRRWRSRT